MIHLDGGRVDPRARYEDVFAAVYEPLQRFARRRASRDDADTVVADTLLVLWRRLDEVPVGAELPWCYQVARRCLANQRRAAARHLRLIDRMVGHARGSSSVASPEVSSDVDEELNAALLQLREPEREVIALWAWEQLEPREIAVVLDITPNAAAIRLHRAKQRLGELLGGRKDRRASGHSPVGHAEE